MSPQRPRQPDREPVLPNRAAEDDPEGWGDRPEDDSDRRLLDEVPPHHGD